MKGSKWIGLVAAVALINSVAFGQLGKGKPGGGGSGGQGSPPPRSTPPPKQDPPPPPRNMPPPKQDPPPPPRTMPPPKQDPPPRPREVPPPRQQPPDPKPNPKQDPPPRQVPPPDPKPLPTKGNGGSGNSGGLGSGNSGNGNSLPPIRPDRKNQNPPASDENRPGRIDRNGNMQIAPGTKKETRNVTGKSYKGSVNNLLKDRNVRPIDVDRIPSNIRSGSLQHQVIREDNVRRSGYRTGYYHYSSNWCDDWFWYPSYSFTPYNNHCVVSPWYYYPSLPGYLNYNNVIIINLGTISPWRGSYYRYVRVNNFYGNGNDYRYSNDYRDYRRNNLDTAIDDLVYAFEEQDRRALSGLIPARGRVDIYLDGNYDYSVNADSFYDLMLDAVYNTQTRRYDIVSVQTYNDEAEVIARHDYVDPWGRNNSVYHWYRLEEDRRGYVITKFGTSSTRRW